jgi:hypothetical protein
MKQTIALNTCIIWPQAFNTCLGSVDRNHLRIPFSAVRPLGFLDELLRIAGLLSTKLCGNKKGFDSLGADFVCDVRDTAGIVYRHKQNFMSPHLFYRPAAQRAAWRCPQTASCNALGPYEIPCQV